MLACQGCYTVGMHPDVIQQVRAMNQRFYQTYARSFSASRQRVQAGVGRLLPRLKDCTRVLDLGCGNANLFPALQGTGFKGEYVGLDGSLELLSTAESLAPEVESNQRLCVQADLNAPAWPIPAQEGVFDAVVCFAALHHIPGTAAQAALFRSAFQALSAGGIFCVSVWQVRSSPRLTARIVPWSTAGIHTDQVDEGDLLLDWRAAPALPAELRYVHHFTEGELSALAEATGFSLCETFYSDGREGNLALYAVWQKPLA